MNKYIFNYNADPNLPKCNEENIIENAHVKVSKINNCNIYYIDNNVNYKSVKPLNTCNIMLISTCNSGHTISEIISFINYYKTNNYNNLIAISEHFIKSLPFMYELVKLFIPEKKFIILYEKYIYRIKKLITYRNHHFNYIKNWESVNFNLSNNNLYFENIQYIKNDFLSDSIFLFDKIKDIYNKYKNKYVLYDNIMLIKFNNENCTTPQRGFDILKSEIVNILNNNNIKIVSISDFKDIFHYICCLYNAKNIILSYGSTCCTNRFFCNPDANVICLANKHYINEYEYKNESKLYWHVRHSHLMPVKKQTFLLDFDNDINLNNINNILEKLI